MGLQASKQRHESRGSRTWEAWACLLITLTLLPFTFNMMGFAYLIAAIVLGIPFLYLAWKLWRDYSKATSKRLYKFSQTYLALIFLVMVLDSSLL